MRVHVLHTRYNLTHVPLPSSPLPSRLYVTVHLLEARHRAHVPVAVQVRNQRARDAGVLDTASTPLSWSQRLALPQLDGAVATRSREAFSLLPSHS
jgi:hypothetical protein